MLEIVHDIAPGRRARLRDRAHQRRRFADNIRALRFDADCDVIVDDILYYNECAVPGRPDRPGGQRRHRRRRAVLQLGRQRGQHARRHLGQLRGRLPRLRRTVGKIAGEAHDFDPGPAVQVFEPISGQLRRGVPITLHWADPLGAAAYDYDLYLFDAAPATLLNFSQNVQDGNDDPYERFDTPRSAARAAARGRALLRRAALLPASSAFGGRFSAADGLPAWVTPGVTRGHSAAADAFSMAAAPANDPLPFALEPGDPPNPRGPFPGVFTVAQLPERFTSDGPRRMFFAADGTPAPQVRAKPDITAADGVSTSVAGLRRVLRHRGRRAARRRDRRAGAAPATRRRRSPTCARRSRAPRSTSRPPASTTAPATASCAPTACSSTPARRRSRSSRAQQPTVDADDGDGDAYLEPGETATLRMPVTNVGDGTATGISVTVTTPDAEVDGHPAHPRLRRPAAAGATVSRDFTLTLAATTRSASAVALAVRVTFAGVLSPTKATFTVADRPARHDPGEVLLHRPARARSRTPARSARRSRSRSPASASRPS